MKPKLLPVLELCIENGIKQGINRSYKHTDNPDIQIIETNIYDNIMNEIYEWFDFDQTTQE